MALTADDGSSAKDLPIFMAHGSVDPVLPLELGQQSASRLRELGYTVSLREYAMGHAVCLEEIIAIGEWLNTIYSE